MELPTLLAQLLPEILSAKRIGTFLSALDVEYLSDPTTDGEPIPSADRIYVRGTVTWDIPEPTAPNTANPIFQLRDLDIEFPRGQISLIAGKFGCGKTLLLLSLLGEARLVDGKISYLLSHIINPSDDSISVWTMQKNGVAYVPQVGQCLIAEEVRVDLRRRGCRVRVSGMPPCSCDLRLTDSENILFGLPMNFERYRAVIFVSTRPLA